ncbi:MAG: hypothetical protein LBE76_00425 [Nitrososphaerota archaeon]|nr:hypothetical protein [Nitrososphaerota archaeon]
MNNGGGVGISYEDLNYLYVSNGVVFRSNRAVAAYNRASTDNALYNSLIGSGVTRTSPFTHGYNNYDIGYTKGVRVTDTYSGSDSGGSSGGLPSKPSPSTTPSNPTPSETTQPTPTNSEITGDTIPSLIFWVVVAISLAVVVVLIVVAVFAQKRSKV